MRRTLVAAVLALGLMGIHAQQADAAWWNQQFVAVSLDFDTLETFEDPSPDNPGGTTLIVLGEVSDTGTIFQLDNASFGDLIVPVADASAVVQGGVAQLGLRFDADGNVIEALLFVQADPFLPPIDLLDLF